MSSIAHLNLGAAVRALVELHGGKGGAVHAVATGPGADGHDRVAHPFGLPAHQVVEAQDPDAHDVDDRIPLVAGVEDRLSPHGRDADAVPVVTHATHDAVEQVTGTRRIEGSEVEAVEDRDRARAHREDVPQDASRSGRRPLIGLDGRRVIVGFDLEGHAPAVARIDHARVLSGPLDHEGSFRGEGLEVRA